jgi:hypothetical protein
LDTVKKELDLQIANVLYHNFNNNLLLYIDQTNFGICPQYFENTRISFERI